MSRGTLDDRYLIWLYGQVADVKIRRGKETYWELLRQLYSEPFSYFVGNDVDRASDGIDLRHAFADEVGIETLPTQWVELECSFLEMLVALSKRLEFQTSEKFEVWFWQLIKNLGFEGYHDKAGYPFNNVISKIQEINERTYDESGNGGLFPLRNAKKDQRKVDLWYQMSEYLLQDM